MESAFYSQFFCVHRCLIKTCQELGRITEMAFEKAVQVHEKDKEQQARHEAVFSPDV